MSCKIQVRLPEDHHLTSLKTHDFRSMAQNSRKYYKDQFHIKGHLSRSARCSHFWGRGEGKLAYDIVLFPNRIPFISGGLSLLSQSKGGGRHLTQFWKSNSTCLLKFPRTIILGISRSRTEPTSNNSGRERQNYIKQWLGKRYSHANNYHPAIAEQKYLEAFWKVLHV